MRQIGALADQAEAQRFADYLLVQGVETRLDPAGGGYSIWALDENDIERARAAFDEFQRDPTAPRYAAAQPLAEKRRAETQAAQRKGQGNVIELRERWRAPAQGTAPLTMLLIAASVVITLWTDFGKNDAVADWLWMSNFVDGLPEIREGQVWRLWTPMFLHLAPMHLIFNMYWLYLLGRAVEIRLGTWRLALVVLASQLISGLVQYAWSGPGYGGMSGVGYALFGFCWMKSRFDPRAGIFVDPGTTFMMIAWLFICMTGAVGPVANAAHVGGLLAGIAFGYVPLLGKE